ncbi:hypothetical protein J4212_00970 [Candidatus Woesearchaeota archaeon]|nr:hypothetical protein [Candidatus Woesearchaeota archaeon]
MMKKGLLIALLIFASIPTALAGLDGQCIIRQGACSNNEEEAILSATGASNAHVSMNTTFYGYKVCCPGTKIGSNCTDEYYRSQGTNSAFSTQILRLSGEKNAQVEEIHTQSGWNPYPNSTCLSTSSLITCEYRSSCQKDTYCVMKISNDTNAHVQSCEKAAYPISLCCSTFFEKETPGENPIPGFCRHKTQCLNSTKGSIFQNNPDNFQCVNDTQYTGNSYCELGNWTSRTKFVAMQMAQIAGSDPFTLFCDTRENTLNYVQYIVPGTGNTASSLLSGTNNFCVLNYNGKVIFGTTLNSDINSQDNHFIETLSTNGLSLQNCNVPANAEGRFAECGGSGGKVFYAKGLQAVIYSRDSAIGSFNPIIFSELQNQQQETVFTIIKKIIRRLSGTGPTEQALFISKLQMFDRLYVAQGSGKTVRGTLEGFQTKTAYVQYKGFGSLNICNYVKQYNGTENTNPSQTEAICEQDSEGFSVAVHGSSTSGIDPEEVWTDLTSSVQLS